MKNLLTLAGLVILLTGCCGQNFETAQGPQGPKGDPGQDITPVATPAPVVDPIQALVDAENSYREGLGQTALTNGLSCVLYTVTGGDRIQASISGHNTLTGITQVASFRLTSAINQPVAPITDGMNVLPAALRPVYQNLYLLRCTGYIVVTATDYYNFSLASDDGSVMYVDGAKLIDNDNNHGSVTVVAQKYLRQGVHAFRLDYAQTGAGSEALIVQAGSASTGAMGLIDPAYYFH